MLKYKQCTSAILTVFYNHIKMLKYLFSTNANKHVDTITCNDHLNRRMQKSILGSMINIIIKYE